MVFMSENITLHKSKEVVFSVVVCIYQTFSYSKDEVLSCVFSWSLL